MRRGNSDGQGMPLLSRIQTRFALGLLIASLPGFVIFGIYAAHRFNEENRAAIEHLQQQALSIASTRGVLLDQTEALLRSLASLPQLRNMSQEPRACTEVLAKTLQHAQQYANIAAADMQGRVICQGIAVTPPQPFNANDGAWFQRVVARRDFVVGNYAIGRGGGERSVDTAYPIFGDNHSMIGAVYAGIRVSWLSERFAALNVPRGIVVALLDSDGTILFRHPQSELGSLTGWKMPGAAQLIAEQGKGITEVKMMNGVYRTVAFAPLGGMRWSALTVVAAAEPPPFWGTVWGLVGVHVDSAIILFLTVLAGVLGAYWLVIRPVRLLEGAVEAYASGDHSARAGEMDRGELGHLARTFNAMAERLNQQESALRVSSAQKSRYLAIASHDLRQPLQIMMMGLETGARNTEGKVRAGLERAQRAAERLQGQLDVLADVVRAEMFGADPQSRIRAVPLSDLFRRVREAHLQTAAAKGLALHVIESSLAVASNPDALYTIVNNLVINAITYTEEGRVVVGCRRVGKMCRIEVHDTGPGIPPESYARIFEAFHRLDPETGFGLGLGLTIVKETASLLGHAVSVQSTPRRGSCFRVEVPLWRIKPK